MKTFKGDSCIINYNSDLSGDVIIKNCKEEEIKIAGYDLLIFIGEYICQKKLVN